MFEREQYWIDEETGRWLAHDLTWDVVTSARTRDQAEINLKAVRDLYLKECVRKQ